MKIILDGRGIINEYDGISRYSLNVIRAVTEADSNLSITVLIRDDLSDMTRKDFPGGLHLQPLPFGHLSMKTLLHLGSIVDSFGADIYHSFFCLQPLHMKTPGIMTIHDTMWLQKPWLQSKGKWMRTVIGWIYHKLAVRLSTLSARRVVTVSKATQKDFLSIWPSARSKTCVIGEGVDKKFSPVKDQIKHNRLTQTLGVTGLSYLMVIGSGKPYKNVESVLKAFAGIKDNHTLHLVMVGRHSVYTKQNIELAGRLGLGHRFHYLGSVRDEELVALLQGAVALVFPSLYEGFGLPVIEAMACGCPVITSYKGSLKEVAGDAVLRVEPLNINQITNAMSTLATNADLSLILKKKGLAQASRFNWTKVGTDILDMYRQLD